MYAQFEQHYFNCCFMLSYYNCCLMLCYYNCCFMLCYFDCCFMLRYYNCCFMLCYYNCCLMLCYFNCCFMLCYFNCCLILCYLCFFDYTCRSVGTYPYFFVFEPYTALYYVLEVCYVIICLVFVFSQGNNCILSKKNN